VAPKLVERTRLIRGCGVLRFAAGKLATVVRFVLVEVDPF
jgi:hypothetical protein